MIEENNRRVRGSTVEVSNQQRSGADSTSVNIDNGVTDLDDTDLGVSCNRALVSKVVKHYGPLLRTYFYNRLRSQDEVDDYLQELYCRVLVYKHPSQIQSVKKFVFTIALNLMRDKSRRVITRMGKKMIPIDEMDEAEAVFIDSANPTRVIAGMQKMVQVERVINRFPINCKKAFLLHRVQGLTQKEIALKIGVTVSAVEKYIMLAKKKLFEEVIDF